MLKELSELKQSEEVQLIVFKLGQEEYTLPIESVQEIIMPLSITRIPNAPVYIEGVINLRDHIIPVIDGRKKFGLGTAQTSNDTRIIVLDLEETTLGLVVDAVEEVVHLKSEDIDPPPLNADENAEFIYGIGKYQKRLLVLLNPMRFLSEHETVNLKKVTVNS